ncbi:MAG: 1,4-dihydroxy-2-naphthoate polyprenyltransferase [Alkalibacterium gilvum]|uniref:1,4-dihydroxy-2-naphthoate octaprenyltransferase n=1 Tax=Alkalibacterium gilvum TaxID=1130080 RepID=A0A1H6V2P8_9LACT|nr:MULTISPECIES: 1,4-dihydroxy-2-naphthoate polyprenyltransferase [Alkalibacterium]MDN6195800.1 1,4-dihydroxy-2-naphthoate polyprenyltransferase [Atopostipes suicloacalis]MDN6293986.1 1,4-dihydroxy-2-naphthoate polyprenyltransferase [Alkalibacterium sp.]MDN6730120.1 1,4-dihydroxy-2-naphthoate polyprenyltransferase [Alkalibacterium sp.]SEI96127.1 1,4-dihydroxy-2-naphthoate octaprenyltransferase [Alkalibacterium gilvum]
MSFTVFLKLVEIQTKIASLFPFLLGVLFSAYYFSEFDLSNTILFFVAMILFDMTTTAINNLMDFKKAKDDHYRKNTNIIGQAGISKKSVVRLILFMLLLSAALGILLVYQTSILLLAIGAVCFGIGIFYTYGPIPISRTPLGEILSGLTMGFGIFFISVFINDTNSDLVHIAFDGAEFLLGGNMLDIFSVFFVSLPTVFLIANIMLANNTCDLEEDIANHRFTLPFYIGKEKAVQLFNLLMFFCYAVIAVSVLLGYLHPIMLGIFLTSPLIKKNLNAYNEKQIKRETFVVAIKNIVLFSSVEVLLLTISLFFK